MGENARAPWVATPAGVVVDADGKPVAVVRRFDDLSLIASAPELLESLRVARAFVASDRGSFHASVVFPDGSMDGADREIVGEYDDALATIDAALAKATGEQA